ncbi:uncharacterized protein LOC132554084 [Ylistrum balloti]|uniref:uncharacterized protein LOC132554084 n=1 Tax=Ylistrum balloti TaxID=509963 RepID=UPI002905C83C|nr:uncharacterized protein LOC132554084 [Ylistrum balloti]
MLSLCILIFLSLQIVEGVVNCDGQADGNYEVTCLGYTNCHDGVATDVDCYDGKLYNPTSNQCDDPIYPPCNIDRDCSGTPNGRFPDMETNCTSYYTCSNGIFFGHNFCNPGLVYDQIKQLCNWPHNVSPPCGTSTR